MSMVINGWNQCNIQAQGISEIILKQPSFIEGIYDEINSHKKNEW